MLLTWNTWKLHINSNDSRSISISLWTEYISYKPNVIPKDLVFSARRKLIKNKWFCLYVISVRGLNKHLKCNVILSHSACIVSYRKHLLSSAGIYLPSISSSVCGIVTSSLLDYTTFYLLQIHLLISGYRAIGYEIIITDKDVYGKNGISYQRMRQGNQLMRDVLD